MEAHRALIRVTPEWLAAKLEADYPELAKWGVVVVGGAWDFQRWEFGIHALSEAFPACSEGSASPWWP